MGIGTEVFKSQFLIDKLNRSQRRDDLISAMYTVLHYYAPLPWMDKSQVYNEEEKVTLRREYG